MLNPGDIVDNRFEVLQLIGQGGLAEVFKVRHMELGSIYALKLLTWRRERLAERMVLEGRIQAQLKHPNIVSVLDLVRHDGQVGLLMEFIDGDTLEGTILAGATPVDAALALFSGILAAVDAAHSAGVLHRDLKPANVMLARAGSLVIPKVADFGLAKVVLESASGMTKVGVTMGTPGYVAPEQLADAASAGPKADVFALGVILHELLTGERAYAIEEDGYVAVHATANVALPDLRDLAPHVPEYIVAAIERATERDTRARFDSCLGFAAALYAEHPRLLDQVTDHLSGEPVALSLSGQSVVPSSAPTPTVGAAAATLAAPRSRVALWVAITGIGLLFSVVAVALVAAVGTGFLSAPDAVPAEPVVTAAVVTAVDADTQAPVVVPIERDTERDTDTDTASAGDAVADAAPLVPEPEPESIVRPEPVPAVVVPAVVVPATVVPEPPTEPEDPQYTELAGSWAGTAARQRMTLEFDTTASGVVSGRMTLAFGPTVRTELLSGTLSPGGALAFTAGELMFRGTARSGRMSGTYSSAGRDRQLDWDATR